MGPDGEHALREADERTRRALAATNTAVWELDLDRRTVTWSANLDAVTKRQIDNLEDGLMPVHPADEPRVRAAWMATLNDHRDYNVECRLLWPDGTVRWVISEGRVLEAANGHPTRLIGSTTDVTDRRTLEDQLRESQRLEAFGRFAGGVAHDFNNLLTVIQGYSQLLADTISDPKQAAEIREVLQAADRARVLTKELLAQSRQQKAAANAGPAASSDSAVPAAGKRKVLVIEDQAAVRTLVRRILEREGFGVLEADESAGAERIFDEHRADIALVLADVGIPGEKGPALFRRLASKKPELRVIYMSGHLEETALSDVPQTVRERFLAKPFTAARLIGVVTDVLRD
jgi:CheY-like chemotaxis protein